MGGFHSEEIFEHDWKSFEAGQWFANTINKKLKQAVRILHNTNTPTTELELTNSWYIISRAKKSDWALPHTHPGSYLSGSFYLSVQHDDHSEVGKGTGRFIAIAENNSISSVMPHREDAKIVEYYPVQDFLILFPSSTLHMVSPHTADYDRIMIAFNTRIKYNDSFS